jgi:hypothetical protein
MLCEAPGKISLKTQIQSRLSKDQISLIAPTQRMVMTVMTTKTMRRQL